MYSLYLHIPFCRHRCAYCDFNTYAGLAHLMPAYVQALCREIEFYRSDSFRLPVHTIYFGGGTPSLLPLESYRLLFSSIASSFDLHACREITFEANPGTLNLAYLSGLREIGFNRISLGMQSARPNELRLLERQHRLEDVTRAVSWARQAGFANLSLDLIFSLPYQTLGDWQDSLESALNLQPQHLSLYALTVEEGTPLYHWVQRGLLWGPDPDLAADMYDLASDRLQTAGFRQYEISNWAKSDPQNAQASLDGCAPPPYACLHNLQYWRNQPYLGLGAGAHGYLRPTDLRVANVLLPQEYISRLQGPAAPLQQAQELQPSPAVDVSTPIDRGAEMAETMLMGLRLTAEGVADAAFRERFGQGLMACYAPQIKRLTDAGLLEWAGKCQDVLRLTHSGRFLSNQVFVAFVE